MITQEYIDKDGNHTKSQFLTLQKSGKNSKSQALVPTS